MSTAGPEYRLVTEADSPAVRRLLSSPDMGRVRVARIFHRDPMAVREVLEPRPGAVCAILDDSMIGLLLIQRAPVQWNGTVRKGVFVRNLTIHPDHRRRGIATELQTRSLQLYAEDCRDALVYGSFQVSNQASLDMVRDNLHHRTPSVFGATLTRLYVPPRRRGVEVRDVHAHELEAVAHGMNAYHERHQLYPPCTPATLRTNLAKEMDGVRPHHVYVAVSRGRVVGGISIRNSIPFSQIQVSGLDWRRRARSWLAGIQDRHGRVRTVRGHSLWFEPGLEHVAERLVDEMRFRWRRTGAVACFADPRDRAWPILSRCMRGNRSEICYMTNATADDTDRPVFRA